VYLKKASILPADVVVKLRSANVKRSDNADLSQTTHTHLKNKDVGGAEKELVKTIEALLKKHKLQLKISFYFLHPQTNLNTRITAVAELFHKSEGVYLIHAFKEVNSIHSQNETVNTFLSYPLEIRRSKKYRHVWVDNKSGIPSALTKAIGKAIDDHS
jgi:hypothetical protein